MLTNTLNTPVEALERAFPLKVHRYRLAPWRRWLRYTVVIGDHRSAFVRSPGP